MCATNLRWMAAHVVWTDVPLWTARAVFLLYCVSYSPKAFELGFCLELPVFSVLEYWAGSDNMDGPRPEWERSRVIHTRCTNTELRVDRSVVSHNWFTTCIDIFLGVYKCLKGGYNSKVLDEYIFYLAVLGCVVCILNFKLSNNKKWICLYTV